MYQKRIGLHIAVPTSEDVLYSYSVVRVCMCSMDNSANFIWVAIWNKDLILKFTVYRF